MDVQKESVPEGMIEVPTFYPSEEEFKEFTKYLESIEHLCWPRGLAKIVPPESWLARYSDYDDGTISKRHEPDEVIIRTPIRQVVSGKNGVYQIMNVVEKDRTLRAFRMEAEKQDADNIYTGKFKDKSQRPSIKQIESNFWKTLTSNSPLYGADMEGTFFEESKSNSNSNSNSDFNPGPQSISNPWDLMHLDSLLLRKLGPGVPGVTTPYLYFGMYKSLFGLHTEDMDLYSINYLHYGQPKIWYAVPVTHKPLVENLARQVYSSSNTKNCEEFLRHKSFLIDPLLFKNHQINLTFAVQEPRNFMITFPGAYHFGFNSGFNCAESVNFGLEKWVPYGLKAKPCQCRKDSVKIYMNDFIAAEEYFTPEVAAQAIEDGKGRKGRGRGRRKMVVDLKAEVKGEEEGGKGKRKNEGEEDEGKKGAGKVNGNGAAVKRRRISVKVLGEEESGVEEEQGKEDGAE
eukprot:TRINITY_DN6009_c0_g1_i1.p1 TRINITY_DN6009_c0_g1~~TRINITY_DN6009_c0_g1_i1.p1  ORF type:complete len:469 (-),score=130.81 TRINITY_DN6009_c0_g1_i1:28-1401(-)